MQQLDQLSHNRTGVTLADYWYVGECFLTCQSRPTLDCHLVAVNGLVITTLLLVQDCTATPNDKTCAIAFRGLKGSAHLSSLGEKP